MVHAATPTGELTTTWCPKVDTLEATEPLVKAAVAKARRARGTKLKIHVYDDLADRVVWRGRVK